MIKALIFDLDGVIADSEPISGKTTDMVLAKYGIKRTEEERVRAFGRRSPDIFGDALSARGMKGDIEKMVHMKNKLMIDMIKEGLKPIPDSIEFVEQMKNAGLKVGLATSSHKDKMEMELEQLGINGLFDVTVNGSEVVNGKPHPEIFLKASERLCVPPSECAVIEDTTLGIEAAKSAGMIAIGLDSPNSPGQDMSIADVTAETISDVPSIIKDISV